MYSYSWDSETGGLLLNSSPLQFSKEPRPVYYKELDILGFDQHWKYDRNDSYPYMWAEANSYFYRGRLVAKTKGGSLYTAPELIMLEEPEPNGAPLRFVDVPAMVEKNHDLLEKLVQDTIKKIYNTYVEYRNKVDVFYVAFSGGKDSVVAFDLVQRALPHNKMKVLFGDTGMEFPDTYDVVDANNAKDALKKWKNRISSGEFIVFTEKKQDGERATTMDMLFSVLQAVNKDKFQRCLEAAYSVLPTMYTPSALKLGVECGATRTTRQTFSSGNVNTKLETALKEAWDDPAYWQTHPNLLISQIKMDVDKLIHTAFDKESGRVSIRAIYDMLKAKPYGFMPCNMTAFIMGFVLKEYTNGSYSWSDGLTNDVMDLNKLKEMVNEIISLQITPNPRYKDKYIVEMTEAEKSFNETTSYAFGIPLNLCTSVEQTRERIRNKMKEFSFPIWTIKSILPSMELKTGRAILEELIDSYCGIANSNNMGKSKTDSDIALAIGDLSAKNPDAKEDLRILLTKDNCTAGMRAYVQEFDGSELVTLAEEIGDNGQYINVLRSKFDADAANWVWNVETAQQKIREVILEYRIIAESNKVIPKNVSFSSTIREWCDKCGLIRISYAAAKNYLGDVAPFLELLHTIKKAGTILDSQKQKFLDLLVAHADEFNAFYSNQVELFKKVCAYYLDGFSEEEVRALYQTIPAGTFTNDKTEYMNLIDSKAKDYRNSLGNERLKKLWKDKTGSTSPRQWSKEHLMPILSLVPDREVQTARAAFGAVNKNHPDASSIEKAVTYLENASFYSLMNDQDALDRIFRESIIKSFAVMLTDIDEVKSFLNSRISSEPYEWFGLPEVDKKLEQMAEDKYIREGCTRALEKIDGMDVGDVKRYLKELIKDNMIVGMEIIKEN